jgi:uncharacterized protein
VSATDALDEVVVDSNVFVSGIITRRSIPARIVDALLEPRFRLLISEAQRDELADVFARPKFLTTYAMFLQESRNLLRHIDLNARVVPIAHAPTFGVRDPDDEVILATAVLGHASFLVTGDSDLLALSGDPRIGRLRIVTPREFVEGIDARFTQ